MPTLSYMIPRAVDRIDDRRMKPRPRARTRETPRPRRRLVLDPGDQHQRRPGPPRDTLNDRLDIRIDRKSCRPASIASPHARRCHASGRSSRARRQNKVIDDRWGSESAYQTSDDPASAGLVPVKKSGFGRLLS
jgi:hypothetical protein